MFWKTEDFPEQKIAKIKGKKMCLEKKLFLRPYNFMRRLFKNGIF